MTELRLPQGKHDAAGAQALVDAGYPAVAPLLKGMLEWVQDPNWPVAFVLYPFLGTIGMPLAPFLREVLATDDEDWIFFVISELIAPSAALTAALRDRLQHLAEHPTPRARLIGLDELARDTLDDA